MRWEEEEDSRVWSAQGRRGRRYDIVRHPRKRHFTVYMKRPGENSDPIATARSLPEAKKKADRYNGHHRKVNGNPDAGIGTVLLVGGGIVVAGGYLIFKVMGASKAAQLNSRCTSLRALAQEALTATPDRQAAIRAQVESTQGKFADGGAGDMEWQSWMKSQAAATCSATAGGPI